MGGQTSKDGWIKHLNKTSSSQRAQIQLIFDRLLLRQFSSTFNRLVIQHIASDEAGFEQLPGRLACPSVNPFAAKQNTNRAEKAGSSVGLK
jgi:hypothetical protein